MLQFIYECYLEMEVMLSSSCVQTRREGADGYYTSIFGRVTKQSTEEYLSVYQEQLHKTDSISDLVTFTSTRNRFSGPVFIDDGSEWIPKNTEDVVKFLKDNHVLTPFRFLRPKDDRDVDLILSIEDAEPFFKIRKRCSKIVHDKYAVWFDSLNVDTTALSKGHICIGDLVKMDTYKFYALYAHLLIFRNIIVFGELNAVLKVYCEKAVAYCFVCWKKPSGANSCLYKKATSWICYATAPIEHIETSEVAKILYIFFKYYHNAPDFMLKDFWFAASSVKWILEHTGEVMYTRYFYEPTADWEYIPRRLRYITYRQQSLRTSTYYVNNNIPEYIKELQIRRREFYNKHLKLNDLMYRYSFVGEAL